MEILVWKITEDNYELIETIKGHTNYINKVIELKDGRIFSCSDDKTIKIWEDYKCVKTLRGSAESILSIIEIEHFIVCACLKDDTLRIWDESTYECVKILKDVMCCWSENVLSKLNDNTVLIGGEDIIYSLDIKSFEINVNDDYSFEGVMCIHVNRNGLLLIGNRGGEIIYYDLSSKKALLENKFHDGYWIYNRK